MSDMALAGRMNGCVGLVAEEDRRGSGDRFALAVAADQGVGQIARRRSVEVADDGDNRIGGGVIAAMEGLNVGAGDGV